MAETIYKITLKNSDLYYLFINYNPSKHKLVLLHNLLQYYYRYIKIKYGKYIIISWKCPRI